MTLSCSRTRVVREECWAELSGRPFPECAAQPWGDRSFPALVLHSCSRNLTLGWCAQEHFISRVVEKAQLPCPPQGRPSENAPATLGAKTKYSLLPGDLGCTLERHERVPGKGEPWPWVQNSKSPPPHVQLKFPVAPSTSLSPANPTLQPQLGTTHILSSASPPRPSFPETSG